jgi:hypothetical protein
MKKMFLMVVFALLILEPSAHCAPKQIAIVGVTLKIGMSLADVQAAFSGSSYQLLTPNGKDYLINLNSDYPGSFTIKSGKVVQIEKSWASEKGERFYFVGKALYSSLEKYKGKVILETLQHSEPDHTVNHIRIQTESGIEVVLLVTDNKTLGRSISVHEIIK